MTLSHIIFIWQFSLPTQVAKFSPTLERRHDFLWCRPLLLCGIFDKIFIIFDFYSVFDIFFLEYEQK